MSQTFALVCHETRQKIWVGQGRGMNMTSFYSGVSGTMMRLGRFLQATQGKSLLLIRQDSDDEVYGEYEEFEEPADEPRKYGSPLGELLRLEPGSGDWYVPVAEIKDLATDGSTHRLSVTFLPGGAEKLADDHSSEEPRFYAMRGPGIQIEFFAHLWGLEMREEMPTLVGGLGVLSGRVQLSVRNGR